MWYLKTVKKLTQDCQDLSQTFQACQGVSQTCQVCQDVSQTSKECQDVSQTFKECQDVSQTCQHVSRLPGNVSSGSVRTLTRFDCCYFREQWGSSSLNCVNAVSIRAPAMCQDVSGYWQSLKNGALGRCEAAVRDFPHNMCSYDPSTVEAAVRQEDVMQHLQICPALRRDVSRWSAMVQIHNYTGRVTP